jgi:hypothetical protein
MIKMQVVLKWVDLTILVMQWISIAIGIAVLIDYYFYGQRFFAKGIIGWIGIFLTLGTIIRLSLKNK